MAASAVPEIKRLRPLAGGGESASVELVEIDGRSFVLKRSAPARVAGERLFQAAMARAGLPSLAMADHPALAADEMLLEYVEGSPTVGGRPSPEVVRRWGAAVAGLHGVVTEGFWRIDSGGTLVEGAWTAFVDRITTVALATPRDAERTLPASLVAEAATRLAALRDFRPRQFVLAHGDLHANNALVRGDDVVLFDKASRVWSGPAVFDLSLVASEGFPGARYRVSRPGDDARMAAFCSGYGAIPADEAPWLDHFALAHALTRYPSPHVPDLREIIEAALARLAG